MATARYDFDVLAGAVGDLDLGLDVEIPAGSYITHGYVTVVTVLASDGASTLALMLSAAGDTVRAGPVTVSPWSAPGRTAIGLHAAGVSKVKTSADAATVRLSIAGADLTAGVFDLALFFVETA